MTLTFPLPVADFAATLRVADYDFAPLEAVEISEGGDGAIDTADYGPRLWAGRIVLSRQSFRAAGAMQALLGLMTQGGRSFEMCHPVVTGPAEDPDGALLGAATPSLLAIADGGTTMRLQGLPPQYQLRRGDRVTVLSAGGKVGLHQLGHDIAAGGAGNTDHVAVVPSIRGVAAAGDAVVLIRPYCLAMIRPGSVRPGRPRGVHVFEMSFDWVERL